MYSVSILWDRLYIPSLYSQMLISHALANPIPIPIPLCQNQIYIHHIQYAQSSTSPGILPTPLCSKPSSILLLNDPRSIEHGDSVLDSVDGVADDGEDDKEDDDYDGDDEVAFHHFCGAGGGWWLRWLVGC